MIAAGLYRNLTELFAGMSIVTFMLIGMGIMLIVVEFFQPSYGIASGCGILLLLTGITVRMLSGGTLLMLFYMALICTATLFVAHILMLITQKRAWLSTSLALKLRRSVMEAEGVEQASLLGRAGVATTDIDPEGHIVIDDVNLFVSGNDFIPKGSVVRVVCVEGDSIQVEQTASGDEE